MICIFISVESKTSTKYVAEKLGINNDCYIREVAENFDAVKLLGSGI